MNLASGTAGNPASWPMPMIMTNPGTAGPRCSWAPDSWSIPSNRAHGGDKLYSTNWFMGMFQHPLGVESHLRSRCDAEPGTRHRHGSPLSLAVPDWRNRLWKAAGGRPASARFHHGAGISLCPNDFRTRDDRSVFRAGWRSRARPGRVSASRFGRGNAASAAIASLAGLDAYRERSGDGRARVSQIQIRGQRILRHPSPNENRWNIDSGPINSWAGRVWYFPSENWAAQVSHGPHRAAGGAGTGRSGSLHRIDQLLEAARWSSSLIWGRNHDTISQHNLNSYLVESVLPIRRRNFLTGRIELVDKDELWVPGSLSNRRVYHRVHARYRMDPPRRNRHRRELQSLFAAGCAERRIWVAAHWRQCFPALTASSARLKIRYKNYAG